MFCSQCISTLYIMLSIFWYFVNWWDHPVTTPWTPVTIPWPPVTTPWPPVNTPWPPRDHPWTPHDHPVTTPWTPRDHPVNTRDHPVNTRDHPVTTPWPPRDQQESQINYKCFDNIACECWGYRGYRNLLNSCLNYERSSVHRMYSEESLSCTSKSHQCWRRFLKNLCLVDFFLLFLLAFQMLLSAHLPFFFFALFALFVFLILLTLYWRLILLNNNMTSLRPNNAPSVSALDVVRGQQNITWQTKYHTNNIQNNTHKQNTTADKLPHNTKYHTIDQNTTHRHKTTQQTKYCITQRMLHLRPKYRTHWHTMECIVHGSKIWLFCKTFTSFVALFWKHTWHLHKYSWWVETLYASQTLLQSKLISYKNYRHNTNT